MGSFCRLLINFVVIHVEYTAKATAITDAKSKDYPVIRDIKTAVRIRDPCITFRLLSAPQFIRQCT